ncbi:MAG: hypothetical protein F6K36_12695 [Symploca sp. SIO3C6]|nr:hypothetical protein [Symploca sp. SIO3C6]NET04194.1 hypothetical protein [Symploca sp. SIO2B6]
MRDYERLESLKAGTLSAFALICTYAFNAIANSSVLAKQFEVFAPLQINTLFGLLVKFAIAFLSGFLFGVTYRYVIREDENQHLKDGVVLAFALVRGLAPTEVESHLAFWLLGVLTIESILCFTIARLILDWAIKNYWLKPFKSN